MLLDGAVDLRVEVLYKFSLNQAQQTLPALGEEGREGRMVCAHLFQRSNFYRVGFFRRDVPFSFFRGRRR